MRFLPMIFRAAIRAGELTLVGPDGRAQVFGGQAPGPVVRVRLTDPSLDWKIFLNPELRAAEAYMDGGLEVEAGTIHDFIELFFVNKRHFDLTPSQIFWRGVARRGRRWLQHNPLARSRANVAHHYDLGNDFYADWLDPDMQYSCAYFETPGDTLAQAQRNKQRHIAAKLALAPGMRVLDIGCGWGGLALYLAQVAGVHVTGISLSVAQLEVARDRAARLGLADRVAFRLQDYREVSETFDRVVSVGMAEHVGIGHLDRYLLSVRDRLAPAGVALVHSITTKAPPGVTGPFLRKYIFPGGYAPSLSELFASIERAGLWTLDAEVWRMHYAWTLAAWRDRFLAIRPQVVARYDERFARMWEVYLSACDCAFRHGASCVVQLQLGRTRDAVPVTRDYLAPAKAALRAREAALAPHDQGAPA